MEKKSTFDPLGSLTRPMWIFALGILILNDHFLKVAWSNVLTGKLSDFAGLFLAPVLFACVLNVKTKKGFRRAGLVVGAVFALINLFPTFALFWDKTLSLFHPYVTTVDPSDLVALVSIPLSYFYFTSQGVEFRLSSLKKGAGKALAMVGVAASLASGDPSGDPFIPMESARVSIYNQSNEMHILRIRALNPELSLDCDAITLAPEKYLRARFFGEPTEWLLQSGQQIRVDEFSDKPCDAALVESETLDDVIVFWTDELSIKSFPFDFDIPREIVPDPQTLVIHADYPEGAEDFHEWRFRTECGSRADLCDRQTLAEAAVIPPGTSYFWESDSDIGELHHPKPSSFDERRVEPTEECAAPTAEVGVYWEDDFSRETDLRVLDVVEGLDGCHEIYMRSESANSETSILICVPFDTLSFLRPNETFPTVLLALSEEIIDATQSLLVRAVFYEDGDAQNFGTVKSIHISKGALPPQVEFNFKAKPRLQCEPQFEACGISLPLDLEIDDQVLRPGNSTEVGRVIKREIHLVRAEYLPVNQPQCGAFEVNNIYLETVIITE